MPQNKEVQKALIDGFKRAVDAANEIDYCALVKLDSPVQGQAVLEYYAASDHHGRKIDADKVKELVRIYHSLYAAQKFYKFRLERNVDNITAWLPIWLDGQDAETRLYGGKFILYISSTPQGERVFNSGIQIHGNEHIRLSKEYIDKISE